MRTTLVKFFAIAILGGFLSPSVAEYSYNKKVPEKTIEEQASTLYEEYVGIRFNGIFGVWR